MTLEVLSELRHISQQPLSENDYINDWKAKGNKVGGWLCTYVPEEIIHAAGMLPIRILGDSVNIVDADAYLYTNTCFFARSCLELGLQKGYDFLDALIAGNTCDPVRRLYDVWRHYLPVTTMHIISIPHKVTERAYEFYSNELNAFKEKLEGVIGRQITKECLKESINLYNHSRVLLQELYGLRKEQQPRLSGAETMDIIRAGWRMPRNFYNQALQELLFELKDRPPLPKARARLLISGSLLDRTELIQTIENLNAWVVADELCTGTRYFYYKVDNHIQPMEALAKRYLDRPPCARMRPYTRRVKHIIDLVKEFRVDGVIYEIIKFCELYGHDKPMVREDLEKENIPVLELDLEYGAGSSLGQIKTRVEAFLEMLERRRHYS
jgi:bzd-type benzoyl-CoA reductase N subunit